MSGESLAQGIRQVSKTKVTFFPDFAAVEEALPDIVTAGDLLLTLGAGNVWQVGQHYLEQAGGA